MKKFVGCKITVLAEGMPKPMSGKLISHLKDRIIVESGGKKVRIIKGKIIFFYPDKEPKDSSATDHLVLACANRKIRCEGVKYVITKSDPAESDYEDFMAPCPKRCESCQKGSLGNIRNISGKSLHQMVSGMLFGDYPEGQNEDD